MVAIMKQLNSNAKILVIDDENSVRLTLKKILERKRFYVDTAYDYESAKECILNEHFDLLLVDLGLPDMSGIDIIKEFRDKFGLNAPVIFITGKPDLDSALDAIHLGAVDYIKKPFKIEDLLQIIQNSIKISAFKGPHQIVDEIFDEYIKNIRANIDTIKNQKFGKIPEDYLSIVRDLDQEVDKIETTLRNKWNQ